MKLYKKRMGPYIRMVLNIFCYKWFFLKIQRFQDTSHVKKNYAQFSCKFHFDEINDYYVVLKSYQIFDSKPIGSYILDQ